MTTMPGWDALRPQDPADHVSRSTGPGALDFTFNETCSVLTGWNRRDAVLRMLSGTRAVIGGITGLRPGDCVRLVLYRGQVIVRECRVVGTSLEGVELDHFGTGMLAAAG